MTSNSVKPRFKVEMAFAKTSSPRLVYGTIYGKTRLEYRNFLTENGTLIWRKPLQSLWHPFQGLFADTILCFWTQPVSAPIKRK